MTEKLTPKDASGLITDAEGKYLAVKQWLGSSVVYDGETLAELGTAPDYEDVVWGGGPFLSEEGILADIDPMKQGNGQEEYFLYFVDVNTMQEISNYPLGGSVPEYVQMQDGIAYVMSALYSEGYGDCNTYTSAIEITTGKQLWEFEQKGRWPERINLPVNEDATDLISITDSTFTLINMQTGEASFTETLASSVVETNAYLNYNNFLLFYHKIHLLRFIIFCFWRRHKQWLIFKKNKKFFSNNQNK